MSEGGPISEERLAAGLARNLPEFEALLSCERLSGGASQETYRLLVRTAAGERPLALRRAAGGVTVERMPGHPGLAAEAALMRAAGAAGVPEPEVHWVFSPDDGLGDGFVMEWLEGETLGARIVRSEELAGVRPKLARQCGEVLARIHAIDLDATGLRAQLDPLPPAAYVEQTWERYRVLDTPQPMIDFAGRWLLDHLPPEDELGEVSTLRLVHNDFRNGNIMVSPAGIVAVLDWEVAHIGDPMRDLGWICTASWRFGGEHPVGGFGRREDLFAGYEAESGTPVDPERVKFWEVFGSFWWAVGCLGMAEHYRHGPDQTVERPGIGRRSSECQVDCVNLLIPGPVELLEPPASEPSVDMPRVDELVGSVRDFLRNDVMAATGGRTRFLARVAANSLDIALREGERGPVHEARQVERLRELLGRAGGRVGRAGGRVGRAGGRVGRKGGLHALRWELVEGLRDGSLALDTPGLAEYLRESVVNQVAIDQPRYAGLATALANARA